VPHGAPQRTWQVLETKVRLPRTVGWGHGSPSGFASVFSIPGHASPLREPQSRQHQSHNKSTTRVDHHVACPRTGARTPGQDRRACKSPRGTRSRRADRPAAVATAHDRATHVRSRAFIVVNKQLGKSSDPEGNGTRSHGSHALELKAWLL